MFEESGKFVIAMPLITSSVRLANIRQRSDFSKDQRRAYINAVLCMQRLKPKADPSTVPGARNRYDDFFAVHINKTGTIHSTVSFVVAIGVQCLYLTNREISSIGTDTLLGLTSRF